MVRCTCTLREYTVECYTVASKGLSQLRQLPHNRIGIPLDAMRHAVRTHVSTVKTLTRETEKSGEMRLCMRGQYCCYCTWRVPHSSGTLAATYLIIIPIISNNTFHTKVPFNSSYFSSHLPSAYHWYDTSDRTGAVKRPTPRLLKTQNENCSLQHTDMGISLFETVNHVQRKQTTSLYHPDRSISFYGMPGL
jgi:hypothetical protein